MSHIKVKILTNRDSTTRLMEYVLNECMFYVLFVAVNEMQEIEFAHLDTLGK